MKNTPRRKRGGNPPGTKRCRSERPEYGLLLALVILGATCAYAEPIRFDNPSGAEHFIWYGGTGTDPIGLEIISDAASQTGAYGGVAQFHQANDLPYGDMVSSGLGGGELQVGGPYDSFLVGVDEGVIIPSGTPWNDYGTIFEPGLGSQLPEGQATYLGVQFPLVEGGDMHYGWIGVVYQNTVELDAFAWGYETDPGVPIAAGIPEPGTLALLAFGAAAVAATRRRLRSQID